MRIHEHTSIHKEAMQRQAEIAEAISKGQTKIDRFINADVEGRRAVRLMRSVQFMCQEDAPISMFPKLMRHLTEQDTPDIPKQSYRVYLTRSRYGGQRRADAGGTPGQLKPLEPEVDVTEVAKTVESITGDLEHRYLDTNASFGGSGNRWLPKFLTLYGKKSGQTVKVRGTRWQFCQYQRNAQLVELMQISLLQYDMDWPRVLDTWKSLKKRRPAQSVIFSADDWKRKGKEPEEGEEGPTEPALEEEFVESDDEGDEREMDQEIEQSPPRDYSDEEEDNPFLSDGEEEGEETYHIDKTLH
ncbi:unnamed protein product [Closterium sp. Naga37s-1]|nr:unnamed protein product [Closterium sp. Naga37s-1]